MPAAVRRAGGCDGRRSDYAGGMAYAVYSTTAAAPLLWLGLKKIALTPRARLQVGYRIIPRYIDCYTPSHECRRAELCPHWDVRGIRPGLPMM